MHESPSSACSFKWRAIRWFQSTVHGCLSGFLNFLVVTAHADQAMVCHTQRTLLVAFALEAPIVVFTCIVLAQNADQPWQQWYSHLVSLIQTFLFFASNLLWICVVSPVRNSTRHVLLSTAAHIKNLAFRLLLAHFEQTVCAMLLCTWAEAHNRS